MPSQRKLVLVGRDAALYTLSPAGTDNVTVPGGGFNPSLLQQGVDLLGLFKNITVEVRIKWDDITSSSAMIDERRRLTSDWRATLENQIRSGGSPLLATVEAYDYVQVVFQEEGKGNFITLYGGIDSTSYKVDRGERIESMDVINVGDIAGLGTSIYYQPNIIAP